LVRFAPGSLLGAGLGRHGPLRGPRDDDGGCRCFVLDGATWTVEIASPLRGSQ